MISIISVGTFLTFAMLTGLKGAVNSQDQLSVIYVYQIYTWV